MKLQDVKGPWIGGAVQPPHSAGRITLISPVSEEPLATAPDCDAADVDAAVRAARGALPGWAGAEPAERARCLSELATRLEAAADMAELVTIENGSPITRSRSSNGLVPVRTYRYHAGLAGELADDEVRDWHGHRTIVHSAPAGVVAAIVPWNAPQVLISNKLGPALAAGNTVVLKPSPETSLDAIRLGELIAESGFPPGVVNIVTGGRGTGEALVTHPGVDLVSFTGSTAAGRSIAAQCGQLLRPVVLELGGKSAAVILEDADLAVFRAQLITTCVPNTGQVCYSSTRLLAPRSRYDEVIEATRDVLATARIGDPSVPETAFGPLVTAGQRARVEGYIASGISDGARLVLGGGRPAGLPTGYYVDPTLFADVDNGLRIAQEEIFGPVLAVMPYDTEDEAVRIANDSVYGLNGSVFTSDIGHGTEIARRIDSGAVNINGYRAAPNAPAGGHRASGLGQEGGPEGLLAYRKQTSIGLPPPA
jgi:acyl-CoA reductase-like NAD-dependent aldehyde dehydrogenase